MPVLMDCVRARRENGKGLQCSTNDQATEARSKTLTVQGSGSACVPRKEGCLRTGQSTEERLEGERVGAGGWGWGG